MSLGLSANGRFRISGDLFTALLHVPDATFEARAGLVGALRTW
jgi:hypothetical protein